MKGTSSDEDSDNDIALLTQKFKKYLRKNRFKNNTKNKFEHKKDQVICYECKKSGHYKNDCPQAKKRTSKKKALKATWDDSSASKEEESNTEQVAHYALIALGEETNPQARSKRWYPDSECSRHMTGDPSHFSMLTSKEEGYVTFGDNNKGKIISKGPLVTNLVFPLMMFY